MRLNNFKILSHILITYKQLTLVYIYMYKQIHVYKYVNIHVYKTKYILKQYKIKD